MADMRQTFRQIEQINVEPFATYRNRSQRNPGLPSSSWKHFDLPGPSDFRKPRTIFSLLDEQLIEIFTAHFSSATFVAFYQDQVILVIHVAAIRLAKFTQKESVGKSKSNLCCACIGRLIFELKNITIFTTSYDYFYCFSCINLLLTRWTAIFCNTQGTLCSQSDILWRFLWLVNVSLVNSGITCSRAWWESPRKPFD